MGQGLSRKRTGIGKISEDGKDGVQDVSVNGDVVNAEIAKTEVNGSAVKTNADQAVADAESETASTKKDKKKRKRFFFSLKRTRPGSGRKKKEKKDKQANHNTSTDSGKSNRSSLFMDEFQIPEDDGIDSVSLSSNEAENKKKNGDDVIRRSKRSSKDGKKSKKKKQKTEKKKGDKSKKKNSKDETEANAKTATETSASATTAAKSADDSLNLNESVEPLHTSVEAAVDEAKAANQNAELKSNEAAKAAEDDLVAAVTAVMDTKSPVEISSEGAVSASETSALVDGKEAETVKAVVNEEVVQPVEAVVQEAALTPENAHQSESSPSKVEDPANQSLDENGKPIRVSLGPRLKTAILKKYSGASDVPQDSQRVTLTKPKIVDVPDPIPPARKNRARRTLSQTPSNTSGIDLNASTSSSIAQSPLKEPTPSGSDVPSPEVTSSNVTSSEVTSSEVTSSEVTSSEVPPTEVASSEVASSEVASSEVASSEVASSEVPPTKASTGEVQATEVPVSVVSSTEEPETKTSTNEVSDTGISKNIVSGVIEVTVTTISENSVSEPVNEQSSIDKTEETTSSIEPEETNKNEDVSTNDEKQLNEKRDETESKSESEATITEPEEKSAGTIITEVSTGMTLAEQAKVVVQQVIERSTSSLAETKANTPREAEPLEKSAKEISETPSSEKDAPTVIETPILKEETSTVESAVENDDNEKSSEGHCEKESTPSESACGKEDTEKDSEKDSGGFVLREMEIIVVGTRTYDEPEKNEEKGEPVVIIERIHVEPYYGPEVPEEETSAETEGKKHKYSKETGEVCKECLGEDGSEEKNKVVVIETVSVEVHAQEESKVSMDNETEVPKDEPCNDFTDGLVASKSDGGDDSSSTGTDSTVVEEDDREKTLVAEENVEKVEEKIEISENQEGKEQKVLPHLDNDEMTVSEESVKSHSSDKDHSVNVEANDNEQSSGDEPSQGKEVEIKCETDTGNQSCEQEISENNNVRKELFISPDETNDASKAEKEIDSERLVQTEESPGVKQ